MSSKDQVLEDKYAKEAVSFKGATPVIGKAQQIKDTGDLHGFASISQKEREDKAAEKKPDGLFARKMKRIFGAAGDIKGQFLQGFKMGALVGGIFGGLTGVYYAITTRSFMFIPMIAITSGASFGFFMGLGMVLRSEMHEVKESESDDFMLKSIDEESGELRMTPVYRKYQ